jgi:predicted methyltransferase
VVLLCVLTTLFIFDTARSALDTVSRLDVIEAERDQWQRPSDVIRALDLKPGNVVVDLGCGSGYFTLKLSLSVGEGGRVIAEDIRRLPLGFLWFRTVRRRANNVTIVHGAPNDPHLPERVNAILIANTYHEFTDSQAILSHVHQALVPAGQLVVVDREPKPADIGPMGDHGIPAMRVENELRQVGFEIVSRQDHFIDKDPDNETWWLVVARKP